MKHLFKIIAASKSRIIAHVKMGDDTFNLIARGDKLSGVYNGSDILLEENTPEAIDKISYVLKDFIGNCIDRRKNANLTVLRGKETNNFNGVIDQIKSSREPKKVVVKFLPENPVDIERTIRPLFDVESSIRSGVMIEALRDFSNVLCEMNNVLNAAREDALILTKGKMINTMWGAKPMQHILSNLHEEIENNKDWEKVEFFCVMINKSIKCLLNKLTTELSKVCEEEKKVIWKVLVPNILGNYEQFKKTAISALMSLSSLIYIDETFKKATSYPANWFLSGGMLDDLKQDYFKLIDLMVHTPRIERQVIYPLDFMKLQYISKTIG